MNMTEREEIEELHQKYISLRENTPMMKRDGEECSVELITNGMIKRMCISSLLTICIMIQI